MMTPLSSFTQCYLNLISLLIFFIYIAHKQKIYVLISFNFRISKIGIFIVIYQICVVKPDLPRPSVIDIIIIILYVTFLFSLVLINTNINVLRRLVFTSRLTPQLVVNTIHAKSRVAQFRILIGTNSPALKETKNVSHFNA